MSIRNTLGYMRIYQLGTPTGINPSKYWTFCLVVYGSLLTCYWVTPTTEAS